MHGATRKQRCGPLPRRTISPVRRHTLHLIRAAVIHHQIKLVEQRRIGNLKQNVVFGAGFVIRAMLSTWGFLQCIGYTANACIATEAAKSPVALPCESVPPSGTQAMWVNGISAAPNTVAVIGCPATRTVPACISALRIASYRIHRTRPDTAQPQVLSQYRQVSPSRAW